MRAGLSGPPPVSPPTKERWRGSVAPVAHEPPEHRTGGSRKETRRPEGTTHRRPGGPDSEFLPRCPAPILEPLQKLEHLFPVSVYREQEKVAWLRPAQRLPHRLQFRAGPSDRLRRRPESAQFLLDQGRYFPLGPAPKVLMHLFDHDPVGARLPGHPGQFADCLIRSISRVANKDQAPSCR